MSKEYQNLKLKKVMATYGCELKQSVRIGFLDVVAEDGKIVLHGTIDEIREEMALNTFAYGEPIIHPSATSFTASTPIIKTARKSKVEEITKMMDDELARHDEMLKNAEKMLVGEIEKLQLGECDDSDTDDSGPEIKGHVLTPPPDFELPEDKIGSLQEKYQKLGVKPSYTVVRKKDITNGTFFYECQLRLGYFETTSRGNNKQEAKHKAAGHMLFKITDADPFVKPQEDENYDSGVDTGETIVYNENYVPDGLEEPNPKAPPKATWAGMLPGMTAYVAPYLNRRERRARMFAAKAIPQSQIDKWANEPIPNDVWNMVDKQ